MIHGDRPMEDRIVIRVMQKRNRVVLYFDADPRIRIDRLKVHEEQQAQRQGGLRQD